jgi:hypothetical protein
MIHQKDNLYLLMSGIIIGIYQADDTLLGYKADTFWTLTHHKEQAKSHKLDENGEIPAHIVDNLSRIVTGDMGPLTFFAAGTVQKLRGKAGLRVGYESDNSAEPVFTHAIESEGLQKLSP